MVKRKLAPPPAPAPPDSSPGSSDPSSLSFGSRGAADAFSPGAVVGAYTLEALLGEGGFGVVYAARRSGSGERVAIKALHGSVASSPRIVDRFLREVDVIKLLRHPNIVEVYETGTLPDGRPFYVMEHLDGETAADWLQARWQLTTQQALEILTPVCRALAAAHASGIVHRDVKLSNIFVVRGPGPLRIKLLDFGVAKLLDTSELGSSWNTTAGRTVGSLTIMAPEQILCRKVDERTDIYALGIALYRMLTGKQAFNATSYEGMVRLHLEAPAPRPSLVAPVSPEVDAIVLRCLEKLPEKRYPNVEAILAALEATLESKEPLSDSGIGEAVTAVGAYLRIHVEAEEMDDALADVMGAILDEGERHFGEGEFVIASATGSEILAARPLLGSPEERARERADALGAVTRLYEAIQRSGHEGGRVRVTIDVEVGSLVIRRSPELEIVGGALMDALLARPAAETAGLFTGEERDATVKGA